MSNVGNESNKVEDSRIVNELNITEDKANDSFNIIAACGNGE